MHLRPHRAARETVPVEPKLTDLRRVHELLSREQPQPCDKTRVCNSPEEPGKNPVNRA